MKKFYLMLVMALMTVIANATTVSFTNPDGWSNVNCYCWITVVQTMPAGPASR